MIILINIQTKEKYPTYSLGIIPDFNFAFNWSPETRVLS